MQTDAALALLHRWWRPAALVALIALAWLLAAPRGPAPASLALSGPELGTSPQRRAAGPGEGTTPAPARPRRVVVHVAGAVRRPGVYRVRAPGRLIDAVRRAGGLTADADLTQINLAARLTDGRAIIVPREAAAGGPSPAGSSAAEAPIGKLSLNAATAEQLDGLQGVGPALAAAIIAQRTKLGGFKSLDQLDEVPGVGEARLATLRTQLDL